MQLLKIEIIGHDYVGMAHNGQTITVTSHIIDKIPIFSKEYEHEDIT